MVTETTTQGDSSLPPDTEPEPTEYVRELSDDELVQLTVHLGMRVAAVSEELAKIGQGLPMAQIENHHLIGLLECFVGPEEALRVREWHCTWLDRKLDAVEAGLRIQMLGAMQ